MGHLADVSRQTPSELCIWGLFFSEPHGHIQVQLAVVWEKEFQNYFYNNMINLKT